MLFLKIFPFMKVEGFQLFFFALPVPSNITYKHHIAWIDNVSVSLFVISDSDVEGMPPLYKHAQLKI